MIPIVPSTRAPVVRPLDGAGRAAHIAAPVASQVVSSLPRRAPGAPDLMVVAVLPLVERRAPQTVHLVDVAPVRDGAEEQMITACGHVVVKAAAPLRPQVRARRVQLNQSWGNRLPHLPLALSPPMEHVVRTTEIQYVAIGPKGAVVRCTGSAAERPLIAVKAVRPDHAWGQPSSPPRVHHLLLLRTQAVRSGWWVKLAFRRCTRV